jgi:hypothetical protein
LAKEYGFTDADGTRPDWSEYLRRSIGEILDRGGPANADERFWIEAWHSQLRDEPQWRDLVERMAGALRQRGA